MLIGHGHLLDDFKKLAAQKKLGHGYIFFGAPRIGKRLFAQSFARFLERGVFSADEGEGIPILSDLKLIEPDANHLIGIDAIREIRHFLWQMPNQSPYRTLIVDGSHLMTDEAQNALLKIAEEPTSRALIILITHDPEKMRPTLRSRFQPVYFAPVAAPAVKKWLVTEFKASETAADRLAKESFGCPGLAWRRLRDQKFQELEEQAKRFLSLRHREQANYIKELVAEDDFNMQAFLEAVLIARLPLKTSDFGFWHRALELRRDASYLNINPRLQLTALAATLT
ncbi:MAG: hypothetical protein A2681_02700 [Candidatus Liptonbacteria bacterium RIFCSPHIGHO2_01_FULL_56_18b]|nr:MAG: hypothetical protein A2681_02700 [Candidatus Liptonbacteria bacterium RIFCSPHIGHO2_01_FULL_56_18b]